MFLNTCAYGLINLDCVARIDFDHSEHKEIDIYMNDGKKIYTICFDTDKQAVDAYNELALELEERKNYNNVIDIFDNGKKVIQYSEDDD